MILDTIVRYGTDSVLGDVSTFERKSVESVFLSAYNSAENFYY